MKLRLLGALVALAPLCAAAPVWADQQLMSRPPGTTMLGQLPDATHVAGDLGYSDQGWLQLSTLTADTPCPPTA